MLVEGESWRGRRVLVTGHTGFKGAWLALWLRRLGATVIGLSLPAEHTDGAYAAFSPWDDVEEHLVDLRDHERVAEVVTQADPQIVLHLAAQALVRRSYEDPMGTWATNVLGTGALLEGVRRSPGVEAVVVVTSDKVYRNDGDGHPFSEDAPLGQSDPYSSSKAACEVLTEAWRRSFFANGPRVATARAGNVIGGGDQGTDRLVPDALSALVRREVLRLRFPQAVRPWQHVLEPLHGYLLLADALASGQVDAPAAVNFGPSMESCRPVAEVVDTLHRLAGDGQWEHEPGQRAEATLLTLDSTLAEKSLSWSPRLQLSTALDWTIRWHRVAEAGGDLLGLAEAQIDDYELLIRSEQ